MDVDRDGYVDEEELVSGIRQMFAGDGNTRTIRQDRVDPAALFAKMDADKQERLYISDLESFVMPQVRLITQNPAVRKASFRLTLSEMTHNVSLYIMRRADVDKNGFIEAMDITKLLVDDPVTYELLEDLYNLVPDFMDKHRQVISGSKTLQGPTPVAPSSQMARAVGSKLKTTINRDLNSVQQPRLKQAQFREPVDNRQVINTKAPDANNTHAAAT